MARVRCETVTMTCAGVAAGRRAPAAAALAFAALDRLSSTRGLVPVSDLRAGDTLRASDGRMVTVSAVVRQVAPEAAFGVCLRASEFGADMPAADLVLPEDQQILIACSDIEAICGRAEALVRVGDLAAAGLGHRVSLAEAPRYHLVLDRPVLLPFNGVALAPFVPTEAALAGVDRIARDAVFAQDARLRYAGAAEALALDLPVLDARDARFAAAKAWTAASEAGKVPENPQPIAMNTTCAPGTSGPQPLLPFSGRSRQPRTIC